MNPIMEAIKQRLGGGGAPPSPEMGGGGSGLPPGLMAALGHGAAPVAPVGQDGPIGQESDPGHEQNEVQLLTKILDDMTTFLKVAADEDDKATIAACIANIQKLRAKDQAESDSAMKGQASPRLARKTAASVGGPGGGY